jgi:hypothetical protein
MLPKLLKNRNAARQVTVSMARSSARADGPALRSALVFVVIGLKFETPVSLPDGAAKLNRFCLAASKSEHSSVDSNSRKHRSDFLNG